MQLQRNINRVLVGLKIGEPIPVDGDIAQIPTFLAATTIADSSKSVGNHSTLDPDLQGVPLRNYSRLARIRAGDFNDFVQRARLYAAIYGLIGDTIWWSTFQDLAPCPPISTKKGRFGAVAASVAVGLAAGAAAVYFFTRRFDR